MKLFQRFYAILSCLCFLASGVYVIAFFTLGLPQPKSISPLPQAIANNAFYIALFCLHHSVFARESVKQKLTRFLPKPIERSTYVLISSLLLFLVAKNFQSSDVILWNLKATLLGDLFIAISLLGWVLAILSSFLIDPLAMFGIKQAFQLEDNTKAVFKTPYLYKLVRHPIYLGFMIAFLFTDWMNLNHFLITAAIIAYVFIGKHFEERDLLNTFGESYQNYMSQVNGLIPWQKKRSSNKAASKPKID